MTLQLGETAPDFTVESTEGNIQLHEWLEGSWAVLFSHPADYTPVCTTELGAFAKRKNEFARRGVTCLAVIFGAPGMGSFFIGFIAFLSLASGLMNTYEEESKIGTANKIPR
jgi:hypothetical protein